MNALVASRRWVVPAMLLALHGALVSEPGGAFSRTWLLVHFGLFLLWQPFISTRRAIEPFAALLLVVIVAVTLYFLAGWMIVTWLLLLIGILGGRVFMTQAALRNRFYLLAFCHPLVVLLLFAISHVLLAHGITHHVALFASAIPPCVL